MKDPIAWAWEQLPSDGAPSLSVAVGVDHAVVFEAAVGDADLEGGRRATPETAYLLASVTKPITATAVCVLAERGTLNLDAAAARYLDGAILTDHRGSPPPTVRQLLQHRAGLGAHYRFFYDRHTTPVPAFDEVASRYGHLVFPPGGFCYSNLGYGIVDEVIRSASGSDPATVIRETVFEPLAMSSAFLGPSYLGVAPPASRYASDGTAYSDYDVDHRGASLGWSNAADLVRFGLAHAGGRTVLTDETIRAMRTAIPVDGRRGAAYGLGWGVMDVDGTTMIVHAGGMGGVSTYLLVVPEAGAAIAALANGTDSKLPRMAARHLLREFVPAIAIPDGWWDEDNVDDPAVRVPNDAIGRWEGSIDTYTGEIPIRLELGSADPQLGWLGDEGPAPCTILDPGTRDLALTLPLQLSTPDALVNSPNVTLQLDLDAGTLRGAAHAVDDDSVEPVGNCLAHWVALSRA